MTSITLLTTNALNAVGSKSNNAFYQPTTSVVSNINPNKMGYPQRSEVRLNHEIHIDTPLNQYNFLKKQVNDNMKQQLAVVNVSSQKPVQLEINRQTNTTDLKKIDRLIQKVFLNIQSGAFLVSTVDDMYSLLSEFEQIIYKLDLQSLQEYRDYMKTLFSKIDANENEHIDKVIKSDKQQSKNLVQLIFEIYKRIDKLFGLMIDNYVNTSVEQRRVILNTYLKSPDFLKFDNTYHKRLIEHFNDITKRAERAKGEKRQLAEEQLDVMRSIMQNTTIGDDFMDDPAEYTGYPPPPPPSTGIFGPRDPFTPLPGVPEDKSMYPSASPDDSDFKTPGGAKTPYMPPRPPSRLPPRRLPIDEPSTFPSTSTSETPYFPSSGDKDDVEESKGSVPEKESKEDEPEPRSERLSPLRRLRHMQRIINTVFEAVAREVQIAFFDHFNNDEPTARTRQTYRIAGILIDIGSIIGKLRDEYDDDAITDIDVIEKFTEMSAQYLKDLDEFSEPFRDKVPYLAELNKLRTRVIQQLIAYEANSVASDPIPANIPEAAISDVADIQDRIETILEQAKEKEYDYFKTGQANAIGGYFDAIFARMYSNPELFERSWDTLNIRRDPTSGNVMLGSYEMKSMSFNQFRKMIYDEIKLFNIRFSTLPETPNKDIYISVDRDDVIYIHQLASGGDKFFTMSELLIVHFNTVKSLYNKLGYTFTDVGMTTEDKRLALITVVMEALRSGRVQYYTFELE